MHCIHTSQYLCEHLLDHLLEHENYVLSDNSVGRVAGLAGTNLASLSELIATAVVLILGSCTAGDLVHRKGKLALQNGASGLTLTSWIDYDCIHQLVLYS